MSLRSVLIGSLIVAGGAALMAGGLPQAAPATPQVPVTGPSQTPRADAAPANEPPSAAIHRIIATYCAGCHNQRVKSGELVLDTLDTNDLRTNAEVWEKILKKVRAGAMPPASVGRRRPNKAEHDAFLALIASALDSQWQSAPDPGRPPMHRLNRLQYTNAIRDLFHLEIDGKTMLPADDTGYGFDNIGDVLSVSPGLLDRYLLAATKISRMVVGDPTMRPTQTTYNVPYLSLGQDERMSEDLPFGSRGGVAIHHYFPLDGEYVVKVAVQRSDLADGYNVRGINVANAIDVRLDRQRLKVFTLGAPGRGGGPVGSQDDTIDAGLVVRFAAKAGTHVVGVTFPQDNWEVEGVGLSRLPLTNDAYSRGRITGPGVGRIDMGIDRVEISGPFDSLEPKDSDVHKQVFVCTPVATRDEEPCARRILSSLARRAYRRPVTTAEVDSLLGFYRQGRAEGPFEAGIQTAVQRLLVDINFLFQVERDPEGVKPGAPYRISDLELATRLSIFLWSSIPDDELLTVATQGKLKDPAVLAQQVRRMLADDRAKTLPESFFGQWLTTKNLVNSRPDPKIFPDFDENLRAAFEQETRLFLEAQLTDDRPAMELLTAHYTFANERLAKHYGIPNILGSHFRRVDLPVDSPRAGLLGQGSVLMVTSYNDRTSVVQRGKWILDNVFGTPPPPPPPDVPLFEATEVKGTIRQRMEIHRKNPSCASCHSVIDPPGFALENFDAIGKFRTLDSGSPVDASGAFADGSAFKGPVEFRKALLEYQDAFLNNLTVKLLTYALGRGVENSDMPAVRRILKDAATDEYRWSSVVTAIVKSVPFQMRRAES
jgi:mono/diheme cytochrome c family protein